jgi:hypothetical protein
MGQIPSKIRKFLKTNEVAIKLGINFFGEGVKILIEYFK